jgi:hypothetical protein
MGKAPAFQFYPMDWARDLDEHPLEVEGAWIRICGKLFWENGEAEKSPEQWARILRVDLDKSNEIIDYLIKERICDSVTGDNGKITIISRRMKKEFLAKKNSALRQAKYRKSHENNKKVTPPSSSSSSSRIKKGFQPKKNYQKNYTTNDDIRHQIDGSKLDVVKIAEGYNIYKKQGIKALQNYAQYNGLTTNDIEAITRKK